MKQLFWIFTIFFACYAQASELTARYIVRADFHEFKSRTYPIVVQADITNHSKAPVDHLVWMLYPNRFEKILDNINEINLHRIYPHGISKGGLEVTKLQVDGQLQQVQALTASMPDQFDNVFVKQKLQKPLVPGESLHIEMHAVLNVPEKYGSFGWYRNQLTMSGGWTPTLVSFEQGAFHPEYQLPLSDWHVEMIAPDHLTIALPPRFETARSMEIKNARHVAVKIGDAKRFQIQRGDFQFTIFHEERKENKIKAPFEYLIQNFVEFVEKNGFDQENNYTLAQAPLRQMLVVDGTPISYFSDRAYKVIKALYHFHDVPIYKALFTQLYEDALSRIEHERDLFWVQEVVAWKLTNALVDSLKIKHRDARDIGFMQTFRFLPLIDRVLYTPQFAFYDVFYNLVYPKDPVRDEIRRYPNNQPFGQTILAHMEDEFGKAETQAMVDAYIEKLPEEGFRKFASAYMKKDLSDRFEQWTKPRPRVNYKVVKRRKKKIGKKEYRHSITVEQETDAKLVEPVSLKVSYKDDTSETKKWMTLEKQHTFEFVSDKKIESVEIDPFERLQETTKSDNRKPPYWKFVVLTMSAEYDFEEKEPLILLQGQFRKRYGGLDRINVGGYYLFNAYGANLGYTRLFGKAIDALRLNHGVSMSLNFNMLVDDTSIVETSPPSEILVTDGGFATDLSVSYVFGNQLSYINPLGGAYGGVTFRISNPLLGSQYSYRMASFNIAGIIRFHPNHLWGMRFRIGTSGASEMPSQLQYRLGGITSMRGFPLTDDQFIGKHMALFTNEYRHFLVQDMDVNLWIFRIRKIQGALYSDVGNATDTVQEQANIKAGLTTDASGFGDLFDAKDWKVDVGYGLRMHIDYFGVSPSLLTFDVARSVTNWELGWFYYVGVNQTF